MSWNFKFSLKSDKNNRYFVWRAVDIFCHFSLSSSYNEKCFRQNCRGNQITHLLTNERPTWCHLLFYFAYYVLNIMWSEEGGGLLNSSPNAGSLSGKLCRCVGFTLTLIVLMWRIGWAHNNARKEPIGRWDVFLTVHPWYNNINNQLDATITVY